MYLTEKTKETLVRILGKTVEEIAWMDADEELEYAQSLAKREITYATKVDQRVMSRGSPMIVSGRIKTMDKINEKIAELM